MVAEVRSSPNGEDRSSTPHSDTKLPMTQGQKTNPNASDSRSVRLTLQVPKAARYNPYRAQQEAASPSPEATAHQQEAPKVTVPTAYLEELFSLKCAPLPSPLQSKIVGKQSKGVLIPPLDQVTANIAASQPDQGGDLKPPSSLEREVVVFHPAYQEDANFAAIRMIRGTAPPAGLPSAEGRVTLPPSREVVQEPEGEEEEESELNESMVGSPSSPPRHLWQVPQFPEEIMDVDLTNFFVFQTETSTPELAQARRAIEKVKTRLQSALEQQR